MTDILLRTWLLVGWAFICKGVLVILRTLTMFKAAGDGDGPRSLDLLRETSSGVLSNSLTGIFITGEGWSLHWSHLCCQYVWHERPRDQRLQRTAKLHPFSSLFQNGTPLTKWHTYSPHPSSFSSPFLSLRFSERNSQIQEVFLICAKESTKQSLANTVNPLHQGSSNPVPEGHCPAEFSSKPDQTHLPMIF